MKAVKGLVSFIALALVGASAQACPVTDSFNQSVAQSVAVAIASERSGMSDWKVGDRANYNMTIVQFGMKGTMAKYVAKDEGASLWVNSDVSIMGQAQKAQMQISKADGKVLKLIVNGKEQTPPSNDGMEIISQEASKITVPAGTFDCVHIVAKSSDAPKIEAWINPRDTVMEGTLKQVVTTQQYGDMALELLNFTRAQ